MNKDNKMSIIFIIYIPIWFVSGFLYGYELISEWVFIFVSFPIMVIMGLFIMDIFEKVTS